MRRRSITFGAAAVLLALLAGACGSGTSDELSTEEIQRDVEEAFANATTTTVASTGSDDADPDSLEETVNSVLGGGAETDTGSAGTTTLTENTGVLTATVPSEWSERDVSPTASGKPSLLAATSLSGFGSGATGIGITAALDGTDVPTALSQIEESIDGQASPAPSDCSSSRDGDYATPTGLAGTVETFEGCGGDADAAWAFLALRPTDPGEQVVVAVYGYVTSADEVNQFFDVVDSIEVSA